MDGRWAGLANIVPVLWIGLVAAQARADLLVNRLTRDPVNVNQKLPSCYRAEEQAARQPEPEECNTQALLVMATVLFSNPDHAGPQTTSSSGGASGGLTGGLTNGLGGGGITSGGGTIGGGTTGGSGTPTPTAHAPEPATLISALVGMSLAWLYAAFHRKRLVKP